MLAFGVLGPVEAMSDEGPLDLGGPQQRAVLALLLLRANEVVPRERLIDGLWGDAPPATARETIKVYVGRLRKILDASGPPGRLATRDGGYLFRLDAEELDLERFQRLADQGRQALAEDDPVTAATVLREAEALWRGPALVDVAGAAFAPAERARLEELRLAALENRIEADLVLGRSGTVVPELGQLIRDHPYRERLRRQLMLALYASGRQAEALTAYQDARTMFVEELGIEPSTELKQLERAILVHDPALERHAPANQSVAPSRGRSLRAPALAIGVAVLGAVAASAWMLADRGGTSIPVTPNSVAVLDPASNTLVDDVAVGRAPAFVVAAYEHVWAANTADSTVSKIDAKRRTVQCTIPLDARPAALAAGHGGIWLILGAQTAGSSLELARIDPRFCRVAEGPAEVGTVAQVQARQPLALALSSAWTPGRSAGTLARRDPRTLAVRATVAHESDVVNALAASSDELWAVTADHRLLRIDPVTNTVVENVATGRRPLDVAVGADAVWVASWSDDVVVRYDPVTRSQIAIQVGDGPAAVAVGFGSVWVACSGDGTIWRIDAVTRKVLAHWSLGASPEDIAVGPGGVWAAVYSELPP